MAIDKQELLRRLSFIKYLFLIGIEQANKPEPLSNTAILSFHDSIELFLKLACEHHAISKTNDTFMDYLTALGKILPLTQTGAMDRFNKARVAIKHHGTMISKIDIDAFKSVCLNFYIENTATIFNVNFDSISLINLITYKTTKQHLENSEKEINFLNYEKAIEEITVAFWSSIEEYEANKTKFYGHSPFFFGRDMTFLSSFVMDVEDKKLNEFIDKVKESITSMQTAIKILSLGFDYRKFTKFKLITPIYVRTFGGHTLQQMRSPQYKPEDVRWCFDYVIECCLILQEFDYEIH